MHLVIVFIGIGNVFGDFGDSRQTLGLPKLHRGANLDLLISILATQWSKFESGSPPKGDI